MAIDLTGVRNAVAGILGDTIQIQRDAGVSNDYVDEATGELTQVAGAVIYLGPGAIQHLASTKGVDLDVAERVAPGAQFRLLLPYGSDVPCKRKDLVSAAAVNASTADVSLVGEVYEVVAPSEPSSFSALDIVYLKKADPR